MERCVACTALADVRRELACKGVTLDLLWNEYKAEHPDGYAYTWFRARHSEWASSPDSSNASSCPASTASTPCSPASSSRPTIVLHASRCDRRASRFPGSAVRLTREQCLTKREPLDCLGFALQGVNEVAVIKRGRLSCAREPRAVLWTSTPDRYPQQIPCVKRNLMLIQRRTPMSAMTLPAIKGNPNMPMK
ncbi:hypothetical protein CEJ98_13200 [Burkholderia gladioli pv. gladioli]|nr:hypothetical protein CEJ98_13200 [Burkholderia gladioli pv. gladioli]AWY54897.1 hypothetical protein A8H28_27925 [Burkholderia gladioli pv. gladioli]